MKELVNRLSKGTWYTFISIVIVKFFTVINSVVTARLLGPSNFGIYSILFSLQGVLLLFTTFGYPTVITKFVAEYNVKDPSRVNKIYFTSFFSLMILALVVSLFFFFSANFIACQIYHEKTLKSLIQLMSGVVFLMTLISLNNSVFQGFHKIKLLAQLNILNSVLNLLLMYLLISNFGLIGAPISGIIVGVVFLWLSSFMVLKSLNLKHWNFQLAWDKEFVQKILKLSFPLFLSSLVVLVALWAAKTYLARTVGIKEVGFYQIAESLNYVVGYIPFAVSVPFLPLVSEIDALGTSQLPLVTSKILRYTTLITLPIALTIGLMAKFIILILFGKPYQGAWEITYFLSIGTFLMSFGILIGAVLNGTGRMWDGLWLNCIWVILFVPLSFVLINELGLNGMGYSYVLSHLLYTGIMFMYTTKRLEIKLNGFKSLLVIAITFYLIGSIIIRRYDGINLIMTSGLIIMILISIEYLLLTPDEKKSICSLVSKTFHS